MDAVKLMSEEVVGMINEAVERLISHAPPKEKLNARKAIQSEV